MSNSPDSSGIFHSHYTFLDDKEFQVKGRTLFFVVILFTVLLLVAVFHLYARWVCRYRPSNSNPPSSSSSDAPPQKPKGLDASVIRAMPIILYHQSLGYWASVRYALEFSKTARTLRLSRNVAIATTPTASTRGSPLSLAALYAGHLSGQIPTTLCK